MKKRKSDFQNFSKFTNFKIAIFDLDGVIFSKPWPSDREKVAVSSWDVLFKDLGLYDLHEKLKKCSLRSVLNHIWIGLRRPVVFLRQTDLIKKLSKKL